MTNNAYSFSVLRYRHDPIACEQINVGILISFEEGSEVVFEAAKNLHRVKSAFPGMDINLLRKSLKELKDYCGNILNRNKSDFFLGKQDMNSIIQNLTGIDDGAFTWSDVGFGNCSNISKCKDRLFYRYVGMYEIESVHRRDEGQIWKPFRDLLAERELEGKLVSKFISSETVNLEFKHAYKNGIWHCFQPISFDLVREDSMQDKAAKWVGNLYGLKSAEEELKIYFIVGKPSESTHANAFKRAIDLLKCVPSKNEIWLEDNMVELADKFQNLVSLSHTN